MEIQFITDAQGKKRRQLSHMMSGNGEKRRKITEAEVRTAVINPDRLEDVRKGRKNAFKTTQGRLLKITYKPEGDDITVITAMVRGA